MRRCRPWLAGFALAAGSFVTFADRPAAEEAKKADVAKDDRKVDVTLNATLLEVDPKDRSRNVPCKIHTFKLLKGQLYQIDMVGGFDPYLRIEDTAGNSLAEDDDGGGMLNARLRFQPPRDDVYQIIATSCGGGVGPYTLTIKTFVPQPQKVIPMAAPAPNKPAEHRGAIGPNDAEDKLRQAQSQVVTVDLKEGTAYVFDLISNQFDPYLRLESPDGVNLAENDDGPNGLNSQIEFRAPTTGRYRLVAMPLRRGAQGEYVLRATQK